MRADQKPLTHIGLEIIWMYCDKILDVFGAGSPAYALYNPQSFQSFCEEYREEYMQIPTRKRGFENLILPLQ